MAHAATGTNFHPSTTEFIAQAEDGEARLNTLLSANVEIANNKQLYRREQDELAAEMMRTPMSPVETYKYFGAFLGAFPPAAIFGKTVGYGLSAAHAESTLAIFAFCLLMNLVCLFVGGVMGKAFGSMMLRYERRSWSKMLLQTSLAGLLWAVITGAAGGAIFFGFGAVFGVILAVPIAMVAFPLFAIFHRLLERGGQIEYKHFLPIAFGITTIISAFILGL